MSTYSGKAGEAYRLGSAHRYAERHAWVTDDEDSALLMDALGITGETTEANWPERSVICDAYIDGYLDAQSALGGPLPGRPAGVREGDGTVTGHWVTSGPEQGAVMTRCGAVAVSALTDVTPDSVCGDCFPQ